MTMSEPGTEGPGATENIPLTGEHVLLVLPAYNEEESLPALFERVIETRRINGRDLRIVLVDDGSRDATADVAEGFSHRLPVEVVRHPQNKGLGEAIKSGLLRAAELAHPQDVIVTMDADDTHPPALIERMVRLIHEGNDVVIASRYRYGARVIGLSPFRMFISAAAALLFRTLLPIAGVRDFTCGYRAYRAEILQRVTRRSVEQLVSRSGFECMVEILLRLDNEGAIIREVPLILRYDQKRGASKMDVLGTSLRTLKLLLAWRVRRWTERR